MIESPMPEIPPKPERPVFNWIGLFAELGGLALILVFIGCILNTILVPRDHDILQQIEGLYTVQVPSYANTTESQEVQWLKETQPIKTNCQERLCLSFCCKPCQGNGKGERIKTLMGKGGQKVEKALDLKTIVKNHQKLQTLLRIQMTEKQRKLIALQRRTLVLEDDLSEAEGDIGD